MDSLASTGLHAEDVQTLLGVRSELASSGDADVRIDIASALHVHFLNDLENDEAYEHWPSRLMELLKPMFPGRLPIIGRNLLNAVFLLDPDTQQGLS